MNKACGSDRLLNEYFIESCDILAGHITEIFNIILNLGIFPEIWTKGIIVPLDKKGPKTDVNNYRGITLLSNFGKLFTSVINRRLSDWCNENNKISDAQLGFRENRSTIDAIFILNYLIQKNLSETKKKDCIVPLSTCENVLTAFIKMDYGIICLN